MRTLEVVTDYESISDAFKSEIGIILLRGNIISPRGQTTKEVLMRSFEINDITKIKSNYKNSDVNLAYLTAVTTTQNHYGSDNLIEKYKSSSIYRKDYDIFAYFNGLCLKDVIYKLNTDRNTRQAVLNFGNGFCTNSIFYYIRGGKLYSIVNSRSIDAINKFFYDAQYFCLLQQMIANAVGAKFGKIRWNIGSFHIYKNSLKDLWLSKENRDFLGKVKTLGKVKMNRSIFDIKPNKEYEIILGGGDCERL